MVGVYLKVASQYLYRALPPKEEQPNYGGIVRLHEFSRLDGSCR